MKHRDALWIFQLRNVKVSKMTMKKQKTLHRFAAVAAVLLTLCLVFMMPVGAEAWNPTIDNDGKITLTGNVVLTETWTVSSGQEITLDLAGHSISQVMAKDAAYSMIVNRGILTIEDSSEAKTGKISYANTIPDATDGALWNKGYNTLQNYGTLTIKSGTIETLSTKEVVAKGCPYAIDIQEGTVNIVGGKVINNNYTAIRIDSTTNHAVAPTLIITDGEITGGIEFQNAGSGDQKATLEIRGGTITENTEKPRVLRFINFGTDHEDMKFTISGGEIIGSLNTYIETGATGSWAEVLTVTGGTFTDPTVLNYLGENADVTVKLADNIDISAPITIGKGSATLDLNGKLLDASSYNTSTQPGFGKIWVNSF